MTKTVVILLDEEVILIWAIPPLSHQPPVFFDHNPTHIPPLFTIPFPDGIELDFERLRWNKIDPWYLGFSQPLYLDVSSRDSSSKLHRFQIMLKPDLSTASLHVINTLTFTHDFNGVIFKDYRICEDTLVSCWSHWDRLEGGVYTGLTSARFANFSSHDGPAAKMPLPDIGSEYNLCCCPASGRFVRLDYSNRVAVLDFL